MDFLELLSFKLGLRSFSASPPLSAEMWAVLTVRSRVGSSRCGRGPGLPAPGGPSAELSPSEPANQDLSPGKPSPCQACAAAESWSWARAEQVGASLMGKLTLGFPSPEVGEEELGRLATFNFLCLQNGFLGCRQPGAEASRSSRLQIT